jgi:hypothetical protein
VLFLGKIFISAGATAICYYWIQTDDHYSEAINNPIAPCALIALVSYYVGSLVMGIYGIGVDAILVCYAEDL